MLIHYIKSAGVRKLRDAFEQPCVLTYNDCKGNTACIEHHKVGQIWIG